MSMQKQLSASQQNELLRVLEERFAANMDRHVGLSWAGIQARLEANPEKLWSLQAMENSGGAPDAVGQDAKTGEHLFVDCAPESPAGRRNLCYDQAALAARKKNKPTGSAVDTAHAMGIELLTEDQYRALQALGEFDAKTSSWIQTPEAIRALGGALFCDRRYQHVFVYHNGADSYYSSRGFRGILRV